MKPFRKFAEKCPWLFALLGMVAFVGLVKGVRQLVGYGSAVSPQRELLAGIGELIVAVVVFLLFGLFVGYRRLKPSGSGMGYGFRFLRVLLILTAVIVLGADLIGYVATKAGPSPVWQKVVATVLLLSVGVVEEFTCRGMTFGGLLKALGKTRGGILTAALISSVLFGFVHVMSDVLNGDVADATAVLQAAGKTLSTAMFGFVLAAIYLKTRNIWVPVVLHSVYDGITFLSTFVLKPQTVGQEAELAKYIRTGETGKLGVLIYLVSILILIPFFIKALKEMKKEALPVPSPLDDAWYEPAADTAGTAAADGENAPQ